MFKLPYSCTAWVNTPQSSNVTGYGIRGDDLIVVFGGKSAYKYPGAKDHFLPLLEAESVGKYMSVKVKHLLNEKISSDVLSDKTKLMEIS